MEQFRQVGEVLGSLKALMVLKHEIQINQRQCCLLFDMMQLAFDTISEEIQQHLRLDEKNTKWKALELPMKELHRVFKDADSYIRYCIDVKDWWGKAISLHMNRDCIELHVHNLLSCFPVVIEAVETAAEISGADQDEMQRKRTALVQKYDQDCDDPKFFLWKLGKQYLLPREIWSRLETAWREDRWLLLDKIGEKKIAAATKQEQRLGELLVRKLSEGDATKGKIMSGNVLVGAPDYNVRRRLGSGYPSGGGHLKEIHWLGESFALRTFYGDVTPLLPEIYSVLSLSHPNVLQYLCAFYDEGRKEGFLVMELMSKDLGSYIKEHSGQRNRIPFSIPVAVDIMLQIARGMEYLHSKKIYHGDLNPSNILLKAKTGSFQAKVTGFGITSIKSYSARSPKPTGVNLDIWLAPEVLAELEQSDGKCTTIYTEKADVYSFGMLCFELLNGKLPFEDGHLQGEKMVRNILAGERPLFSYPSPKYLANLTKKCWQTNPNLRPTFASICRILRYIKKILVINPDHGDPDSAPPLVDYCDMEAGYLRKFSGEASGNLAAVTQIPFEMFTYKIVEKEKISGKKWDLAAEGLAHGQVFDDEQLAAMDDFFLVPSDRRSVCSEIIDSKNSGIAMDLRTVISETPHQKLFPFDQKSLGSESPRKRFSTAAAAEIPERKNVSIMDKKSSDIQAVENNTEVQENGKSALTKVTQKLEKNEILEIKKSLRPIADQKPASSTLSEGKTSSLENKRLAEIPEKKTLQDAEPLQMPVSASSTTAKSISKSGNSENSDKKPTLMRKLKAITTKLIPETPKKGSPMSSPARMKKTMPGSSPASSPSRTFKKPGCPETPKSSLKRIGMKITIPNYSPASSPSRDFKKYGANIDTPKNDSLLFSPARMKKPVSTFSPASSPSRAFNTCASPSRASAYHSKDYPSPISSPMNPSIRCSRLGRQTSLPITMSSRRTNIDHIQLR